MECLIQMSSLICSTPDMEKNVTFWNDYLEWSFCADMTYFPTIFSVVHKCFKPPVCRQSITCHLIPQWYPLSAVTFDKNPTRFQTKVKGLNGVQIEEIIISTCYFMMHFAINTSGLKYKPLTKRWKCSTTN